jgi:hypothetical protein
MQSLKSTNGRHIRKANCKFFFLLVLALFLISGCAARGARRVPADRFDYNSAIAQSTREQMLLNIVRSRYLEVPVFLTVSSVLTQYEYNADIGVGTILEFGSGTTDRAIGETNIGFAERPTITYLPVEGQEFSAHLLSDIPSEIIFAAAQAGWPVDIFMRIAIQRLGKAENMAFGEVRATTIMGKQDRPESELVKLKRFERLIDLIFVLSDQEVIEVQEIEEDGKTDRYFIIAEEVPENLKSLLAELKQLLGLSNHKRFRITDRVANIKDDEITIQTRSVMAMMEFMARGVEVPAEHLERGWVVDYGLQDSKGEVADGLIPFRMRSSKNPPEQAFARVKHNDYWYYIDQTDITSKRALSLIIVLFRLQAPTPAGAAPILSLPTGG